MKKTIVFIITIFMLFSSVNFAEKPPKAEELEDGYLIIGQYIVYRTKLTQDIYDGARLTMSDSQKIYYKSEYAKGTWFRIDESDQLAHILMGGSGNAVTTDRLNTFTYTLQIDKDGNVIKFDEGGNVQTFKSITDAIEDDITQKKLGLEAALTDSDKVLGKSVISLTNVLDQEKKELGLETYATSDDISTELAIAKDRLSAAESGATGTGTSGDSKTDAGNGADDGSGDGTSESTTGGAGDGAVTGDGAGDGAGDGSSSGTTDGANDGKNESTSDGSSTGTNKDSSSGADSGTDAKSNEKSDVKAIADAKAKVESLEALLNKQEELDTLKSKLKQATGDKVESINTEILDLQNTLNVLNKSVGIDNEKAIQEEALKSELLSAIDAGNVDLVKEIQKELVQLNPKLADAAILLGVVDDLSKNKADLEQMKLQAQKNGFTALLESLETEIKSNSNKLKDALKDAKSVLNAKLEDKTLSDEKKAELSKALAEVKATEESISDEAVVTSGDDSLKVLVANIEKAVSDNLDKALQKQILKGVDISELTKDDLKLKSVGIKSVLNANETKKTSDLDPLLTEDILNNNMAFNKEETIQNSEKTMDQGLLTKAKIEEIKKSLIEKAKNTQLKLSNAELVDKLSNGDVVITTQEKTDIISQALVDITTAGEDISNKSADSDKLNDEKAAIEDVKNDLLTLIKDLSVIKEASDNAGSTELSKDIDNDLTILDNLYTQLARDEYKYMFDLYKKRYYVLKDYTSDKAKAFEVSLTDYTTVIAGYDLEIEKVKKTGIVDTDELYLEFEAWRYDIEKNSVSYKESIKKLNDYRINRKNELMGTIDDFSKKMDTLLNTLSNLMDFDLSMENKNQLMKVDSDIEKIKSVMKQIGEE